MESEALLALDAGDLDHAERLLGKMTDAELTRYLNLLDRLGSLGREVLREKRRA